MITSRSLTGTEVYKKEEIRGLISRLTFEDDTRTRQNE